MRTDIDSSGNRQLHTLYPSKIQQAFTSISNRSASKGLKINYSKTQLLSIFSILLVHGCEANKVRRGIFLRQYEHNLANRLPVLHCWVFWSEWRLTVIAATVRIALVDILDLSEVDIPAGVFLHPAVGWG